MDGPRPARTIVAPLWPLFVLGLLLLAAACSSPDEPEETVVPFMVCQSSQTWTRPSEEEQSQQVWHGTFGFRYDNWAPAALRSTFCENFFTWSGGNSEMFDKWPLHGLWTAEDWSAGDPACAGPGQVGSGEVISVYLLLHEAKEVRLGGNTFYITVEKRTAGFQQIQFPDVLFPAQAQPTVEHTVMKEDAAEPHPVAKEGSPIDYNIAIVDTNGSELARAEGGHVFQEPTEGSPVPAATQARQLAQRSRSDAGSGIGP